MSVLDALGASFSLSLFVGRVEGAPQWKDGGGKHVATYPPSLRCPALMKHIPTRRSLILHHCSCCLIKAGWKWLREQLL